MIRLTIMYPDAEDAYFDMDYYLATHIPLVKDKMGDGLKGVSVERGLAGMPPGSPAVYAAVGRLLLDSLEDVQTCLAPNDAANEVITAVHRFPAREAQWAPMPDWVGSLRTQRDEH